LKREYQWEANIEESSIIEQNNSGPLADPPGDGYWVLLSETRYIYDGMLVIQERDVNNTPTVTYTRGTDLSGSREGAGGIGGLLARSHGYSSGNWSTHNFYHADGNGNITALVNSSQSLAASYRYDPYGNTISSSGSLASANVYRFSSKEIHANTGLYYYGYRWYAPEVQRWLNWDPIGENGGINLYQFTSNAPVAIIDPLGQKSKCSSSEENYDELIKSIKEKLKVLKKTGKLPCGLGKDSMTVSVCECINTNKDDMKKLATCICALLETDNKRYNDCIANISKGLE
jgi:RHS repeat-associated protein